MFHVYSVATNKKMAGPFEYPKDARTWASLWNGPRILVRIMETPDKENRKDINY